MTSAALSVTLDEDVTSEVILDTAQHLALIRHVSSMDGAFDCGPPETMASLAPMVTRMREGARDQDFIWTISASQSVVSDIMNVVCLHDTCTRLGVSPTTVKDHVAGLGTWLTHVYGGSKAVVRRAVPAPGKPAAMDCELARAAAATNTLVLLPDGYPRTRQDRRDISKALAAIVMATRRGQLNDASHLRFLARSDAESGRATLNFDHVRTVRFYARVGRLHDLEHLHPESPARNRALLSALDLLEGARVEATSAVSALTRLVAELDTLPTDSLVRKLRRLVSLLRWVNEGEVARLAKAIDITAAAPASTAASARRALDRAVRGLGLNAAEPGWLPTHLAQLNEGQVRRIVEGAGMVYGTDGSEEREIRRRLGELGLRTDVDQLIPLGMRAISVGVEDEFWQAMGLRSVGAPDWADDLADVLGV